MYDATIRSDPRFLDEESWVWELREVEGRREKCILVNFPVDGPVMTNADKVQHILDWPVPLTLERKEKAWGRGKRTNTIYRNTLDKSEDYYEAYRALILRRSEGEWDGMVRQGMWPGTVDQFKESVVEDFDRWADESALNEDLSKFILHEYWEQRWEEVVGQQSHSEPVTGFSFSLDPDDIEATFPKSIGDVPARYAPALCQLLPKGNSQSEADLCWEIISDLAPYQAVASECEKLER